MYVLERTKVWNLCLQNVFGSKVLRYELESPQKSSSDFLSLDHIQCRNDRIKIVSVSLFYMIPIADSPRKKDGRVEVAA